MALRSLLMASIPEQSQAGWCGGPAGRGRSDKQPPMPDVPSPLADALRDRYALERELGRGGRSRSAAQRGGLRLTLASVQLLSARPSDRAAQRRNRPREFFEKSLV